MAVEMVMPLPSRWWVPVAGGNSEMSGAIAEGCRVSNTWPATMGSVGVGSEERSIGIVNDWPCLQLVIF
jgi:hypothetical protein